MPLRPPCCCLLSMMLPKNDHSVQNWRNLGWVEGRWDNPLRIRHLCLLNLLFLISHNQFYKKEGGARPYLRMG